MFRQVLMNSLTIRGYSTRVDVVDVCLSESSLAISSSTVSSSSVRLFGSGSFTYSGAFESSNSSLLLDYSNTAPKVGSLNVSFVNAMITVANTLYVFLSVTGTKT